MSFKRKHAETECVDCGSESGGLAWKDGIRCTDCSKKKNKTIWENKD